MTKVLKANSAPRSHRLLGPLSITAKVCLAAAACTLISLIATGVAVGIYASGSAKQNAQRGVNAAATAIAQEVSADLAQSFKVLEGVGTALEVSKAGSNPMPRAELDALLRRTLEHNPNWLATGSLWEPNALDGKDAEYVSKGPENDATGRFVSYWNRASGSIAVEPLVDYDKPGANDWYAIPKATGKKTLIEPYLYKVMGKDVLMTSLVQPVYANGKFVAVVTMDMLLEGLHKTLGTVEAVQGAQVGIVSTAGSYVTNADAAKVGKPASDLSAEALAAVKRAEPYEYVDRGRVRVIAPIVAVREADPWAVVVEYEEAAAQAPAVAMLRTIALIAAFCAAISVAVLVGGLLAVTRPVRRLAETMSRLASGESDLRVQLSVTGDDELGRIATAFNQFTGKLRSVFEDVRETSQAVSAAALQIANGNQDLSARTERQAGNLQGISSSMTELSQAVQSSALTAGQADQVSQEAAATAERTQNVMEGAIAAMADLGASSRRIAEITAVIDGIAFQTNILALNAAVEAARAGEQGRGFAVVAGEVRTLAQRAAGAARDIKQLVEDSVSRAEAGSRRISESAEALLALTNSVNRVTTLVNEMSASAGQQATGIATVETSIVQLDSMTQQNAALVEEASAASESLRHQAQRLTGTLAVFLNNAPAHERR